jgi:hypothetical protein
MCNRSFFCRYYLSQRAFGDFSSSAIQTDLSYHVLRKRQRLIHSSEWVDQGRLEIARPRQVRLTYLCLLKIAMCKKTAATSLKHTKEYVSAGDNDFKQVGGNHDESSGGFARSRSRDATYVRDARARVRTRACKFVHKLWTLARMDI